MAAPSPQRWQKERGSDAGNGLHGAQGHQAPGVPAPVGRALLAYTDAQRAQRDPGGEEEGDERWRGGVGAAARWGPVAQTWSRMQDAARCRVIDVCQSSPLALALALELAWPALLALPSAPVILTTCCGTHELKRPPNGASPDCNEIEERQRSKRDGVVGSSAQLRAAQHAAQRLTIGGHLQGGVQVGHWRADTEGQRGTGERALLSSPSAQDSSPAPAPNHPAHAPASAR